MPMVLQPTARASRLSGPSASSARGNTMNQPTTRRVYPNDPESIVYDMTFTEFHNNDLGYHRWLDARPDGFVLTQWSQNPLGGMVHEAGCPYITRFRSPRTPKVCTTTLSD